MAGLNKEGWWDLLPFHTIGLHVDNLGTTVHGVMAADGVRTKLLLTNLAQIREKSGA